MSMQESRDSIKSRMLRTVAKMWDYPGVENEAAFDPLVALLINACAAELAKINREKKLSQSRLVEEVARLLVPDAKTRATPAHAIAAAFPAEDSGFIYEQEKLVYKEHKAGGEEVERHFSPTARFPLVDAEIKFQASGNNISEIIDHKYKNVLGFTLSDQFLPDATLYLGIDVGKGMESVDELPFFFNMLSAERKDFFFKHLKSSRWFLADQPLDKQLGFPSTVSQEEDLEEILTNRYHNNDKACREINHFYERQFFTLHNVSGLVKARGSMPPELDNVFGEEVLSEVDDNLVWLRVEFPSVVSAELLNDVFCFTNCLPVLNRQLNDEMVRLNDNLNIIPLKSNDFFFDVKKVMDSTDEPYHVYGQEGKEATEENSVLLRTSGVGRFGAFEAKEELQYLLETLKDETASYAAIGSETLEGIVGEMNVLMGDLEEKVSGMTTQESVSYLVMRNLKESEGLLVEYWTTAGKQANNIAAGSYLEVTGSSRVKPRGTIFITPTVGGRNRLSEEEKLTSFRRTLLANNRLVTNQDIKAFCKEQLGSRVQHIEIQKGLANGMGRKEGLVRTIDIRLNSDPGTTTSSGEWDFLLEDLLTKIRSRVAHSFPYRILLDENVYNNHQREELK